MKQRMIFALAAGVLAAAVLPGAVAAAGPSTAWTRQFGTSDKDSVFAVATDANRNQYVVGTTDGTLPGQTSNGESDAFVRKIRPNGATVWTRQFGTSGFDAANGVAIDPAGRIAVAGTSTGTFPGQTNHGDGDAFVRLFRPNGNIVWTRQFGTSGSDLGTGIAIDRAGRIVVAGHTSGTFPAQTSKGGFDAFVRVLRPNGTMAWTRQFGTSAGDFAKGIAVDPAGGIALAGLTNGTLPGQTNNGSGDAFVRLFRADGQNLWTRQFGTSGQESVAGVTVDAKRNKYVVGTTDGTFPGQTNQGNTDAFVRKLSPIGNIVWTRQFGTSTEDFATSIATNSAGRTAVAGSTDGTLPGQSSKGAFDAFVRLLRPDGGMIWSHQFGTSENDVPIGMAIDRTGRIAVGGDTEGSFPGHTNQGSRDAFVRTYR